MRYQRNAPPKLGHFRRSDVLWTWLAATALSGMPSTLYAFVSGADVWEATRAAGAMILTSDAPLPGLAAAAALVHGVVSLFWTLLLAYALPPRGLVPWALAASAAIAVIDLRLIAPIFFPEVAALSFWPQFADHLMWGACVGVTLQVRSNRRKT